MSIDLTQLEKGVQFISARIVILALYVQPNAKRTEFEKIHDDQIKLKVQAVPEDGKANEEIIRYLAKFFSLKRNQVSLVSGELNRHKRVQLIFDEDTSLENLNKFFLT